MAKKDKDEMQQMQMFPYDPEIKGFGIVAYKLKGAIIEVEAQATTMTADLAQLTPERWGDALVGAVVRLLGGDWNKIVAAADKAHHEFWAEINAQQVNADEGFSSGRKTDLDEALNIAKALYERQYLVDENILAKWDEDQQTAVTAWLRGETATPEFITGYYIGQENQEVVEAPEAESELPIAA